MGKVRYKSADGLWKILSPNVSKRNGHMRVALTKDGHRLNISLAKLVALSFVDGYRENYVVHHKKGDLSDNRVENLEWMSALKCNSLNSHLVRRVIPKSDSVRVVSMDGELWRDIDGYEGRYQVSSLGRVKTLNYRQTGNERLMNQRVWPRGYRKVHIGKHYFFVHRVVATAFIGDPTGKEINHKNGDPSDNRVENLEICSHQQNIAHSWDKLGREIWSKGLSGGIGARSRPIKAIDEQGNVVAETKTIAEMANTLGVSDGHLGNVLKGRSKLHKHPNLKFTYETREKYKKQKE